jgi:stage V sporulation protein D (sporulation-specific penicillin-binding protein)
MIYLEAQSTRYYPGNTLAAQVIGFTGSDGNGLFGLEIQYDTYLSGVDGYYIKARDSYGREMPYDYASYIDAIDGYNLNTTIDTTVQSFLEEQLAATVADHEAENRACGIVVDVNTGAILAMATSSPANLNDYATLDPVLADELKYSGLKSDSEEYSTLASNLRQIMWSNKAVTESYIPGSTFKIITSSMALEEGKVSMTESVHCSGYKTLYGHRIHCHKVTGHGALSFAEGLQQSCNVWFMTLGERIGITNYQKYAKAFGYKEKTGIDLPGEGYSIFSSQMTDLDLAIYAFGQNFNVTPIQHIMAISSVANGGKLLEPYVVESITDNSGNVIYQHELTVKRQTVSAEVCKTISQMLEEGVSGNGGAKTAYVAGYRVAAKTGTAEKKERECPVCGYAVIKTVEGNDTLRKCATCLYVGELEMFEESEKYICSAVAYAPADDPQVAIIIMVDEPTHGVLYGSTVAAPYVSAALKNILPYLGVEAEYTAAELEKMALKVGNYKNWSVSAAKKAIEKAGYECEIIGGSEGVVKNQVPAAGSYVEKSSAKIVLYVGSATPEESVTVPDLVGRTAAAANQALVNLGLNVKIEGTTHYLSSASTVVYSQSIAAGTKVAPGTVVTLNFRSVEGD